MGSGVGDGSEEMVRDQERTGGAVGRRWRDVVEWGVAGGVFGGGAGCWRAVARSCGGDTSGVGAV